MKISIIKPLLERLHPKSPAAWFIILWLSGFFSCFFLARCIRLVLPKAPSPQREFVRPAP